MSLARKAAFTALVRYARSSSTRTPRSRPKPRASVVATDFPPSQNTQPVPVDAPQDSWVEVRDPKSNEIYYWNKSTSKIVTRTHLDINS